MVCGCTGTLGPPTGREDQALGSSCAVPWQSMELGSGQGTGIRSTVNFDPIQSAVTRRVSACRGPTRIRFAGLGRGTPQSWDDVATAACVRDCFLFLIDSKVFVVRLRHILRKRRPGSRGLCVIFSCGCSPYCGKRMRVLESHLLNQQIGNERDDSLTRKSILPPVRPMRVFPGVARPTTPTSGAALLTSALGSGSNPAGVSEFLGGFFAARLSPWVEGSLNAVRRGTRNEDLLSL